MTDREKVIKGLEACSLAGTKDDCIGYGCPYLIYNDEVLDDCQEQMFDDALAMLKAQEARLVTLEEAKSVEGYVWLECCDTPILRVSLFHNGYYIEPFEEPVRVDLMNWPDYNKEWRYWTSCPTDEQREATPWE